MGTILAVCVSEKKGTRKQNVGSARFLEDWGIEGDAHAGHWHRQVSLLSYEKIESFRAKGVQVEFGAFGENLVVEGYDFRMLPVGTRFTCGEVVLEITQVGKECHRHCAIYQSMGTCIMPQEGVFAKVIHGGILQVGEELTMTEPAPAIRRTAVVTLSDKGFRGQQTNGLLKKAGENFYLRWRKERWFRRFIPRFWLYPIFYTVHSSYRCFYLRQASTLPFGQSSCRSACSKRLAV